MNTQLPQALKARRVKETLVALGLHVKNASNLARLKPVRTSEPDLSGDSLPPLPEITGIAPNETAYENRGTIGPITVAGNNLKAVQEVRFIRSGEVGPWIACANKIDPSGDGKTLEVQMASLASAPHGHYNLLVVDDTGQTAHLRDAFTIRKPKDRHGEQGGSSSGPDIGKLRLFPPFGYAGQTLPVLVHDRGANFTPETAFEFQPPGLEIIARTVPSADTAHLLVGIPDKTRDQPFDLMARTGGQKDIAHFHVHENRQNYLDRMRKHFGGDL